MRVRSSKSHSGSFLNPRARALTGQSKVVAAVDAVAVGGNDVQVVGEEEIDFRKGSA